MHPDHARYFRYTPKSRLAKSIATLTGIIEGIAIDSRVTVAEVAHLTDWVAQHSDVCHVHPFNELIPMVREALSDGAITDDKRLDILWLCEKMVTDTVFYGDVTTDIQRLHGILHGILADGKITEDELKGLSSWIANHSHLKTCWPYDEIDSIITAVMADGKIDTNEHEVLVSLFVDFVQLEDDLTLSRPKVLIGETLDGLCAVCPDITFENSCFCFTGASARYKREDLKTLVERHGGKFINSVSQTLDYLIIGANGNPCWAYACYGRKVEEAVRLRKQGHKVLLVHENDFQDAVADIGGV